MRRGEKEKKQMGKENTTDAKGEPAVASTALLECPFCGSTPGPDATIDDESIMCDVCLARGPKRKFEWMNGKDDVNGRWNIRYSNT